MAAVAVAAVAVAEVAVAAVAVAAVAVAGVAAATSKGKKTNLRTCLPSRERRRPIQFFVKWRGPWQTHSRTHVHALFKLRAT